MSDEIDAILKKKPLGQAFPKESDQVDEIDSILKKSPPKSDVGVMDTIGNAAKSGFKEAAKQVGGFTAGAQESLPFSGALDKLGAASYAGQQAVADIFRDKENEDTFSNRYHQALQQDKDWRAKAVEAAPTAAKVGNVVGSGTALAVPIPGAGVEGALGAGARLAGQMGYGALEQGTKGDQVFDPKAALEGATTAGIMGGAGEAVGGILSSKPAAAVGDYVSGKLKPVGDYLKGLAEEKAFKAAAGNRAKAYDIAKGQVNQRGRDLLDSGVVGFGDSAKQIGAKANVAADAAWERIGNVLKEIDAKSPGMVDGKVIANTINSEADRLAGQGNTAMTEQLRQKARDYAEMGTMNLGKAQTEKNSWKYKPGADFQLNNIAKGAVGGEMEKAVANAANTGDPELQGKLQEYLNAKRQYGTNVEAERNAGITANRYMKNNSASLGDKLAGGLAGQVVGESPAMIKGPIMAGVMGANKLIRSRGNSTAAVTLDKVGDMLSNNPASLGKYGPMLMDALKRGQPSFALTHQLLLAKDPGYQQLIQGGEQ